LLFQIPILEYNLDRLRTEQEVQVRRRLSDVPDLIIGNEGGEIWGRRTIWNGCSGIDRVETIHSRKRHILSPAKIP